MTTPRRSGIARATASRSWADDTGLRDEDRPARRQSREVERLARVAGEEHDADVGAFHDVLGDLDA